MTGNQRNGEESGHLNIGLSLIYENRDRCRLDLIEIEIGESLLDYSVYG